MRGGGLRAILNIGTSMSTPREADRLYCVAVTARLYCASPRKAAAGMRSKHYRGRASQNKRKEFHLLGLSLLLAFKVKSGRTAQRAYA